MLRLSTLLATVTLVALSGGCGDSSDGGGAGGHGATGGNAGAGAAAGSGGAAAGAGGVAGSSGNAGNPSGGSAGSGGGVSRPAYNTGTGFFVLDGKLYDANGVEFRPRGVNKVHYDLPSPGIAKSHANTLRWVVYDFSKTTENQAVMQGIIDAKIVPIPGAWEGTCKPDTSILDSMVDTWVAQASVWTPYEKYMILNIANEWGPSASDGTGWRDAYISAIGKLRSAGYKCTLSITSGGCGQDNGDLVKYAKDVFDADPQKNVIFDQHIYGGWANGGGQSWQTDLKTGFDALKNLGLVVTIGEFGPGRDIGPSPTDMDPLTIVAEAEKRNFGWLAWAWDDNNLPNAKADDNWFSLTYDPSVGYASANADDLTIFGKQIVLDATHGLTALAKPATVF